MSDNNDDASGDFVGEQEEEEEDDDQSYRYETCSEDEEDQSLAKRQRENDEIPRSCSQLRRKYLDAGESEMRMWSDGNSIKMSIAAAIRQIADQPSGHLSVLSSLDALINDDVLKTFRIFIDVCPSMTVTYDLIFNTTSEIKESPPILKCTT